MDNEILDVSKIRKLLFLRPNGSYSDFAKNKFIDDAELAGLKEILVIHGKGTGALRKGIHEYLKRHRSVKSFVFADIDEGGSGATVVYLK